MMLRLEIDTSFLISKQETKFPLISKYNFFEADSGWEIAGIIAYNLMRYASLAVKKWIISHAYVFILLQIIQPSCGGLITFSDDGGGQRLKKSIL